LICFIFNIGDKIKSHWIDFSQELRGKIILDEGIPFDFAIPHKNEKVIIKNKIEHLYVCGCLTGVCVLNTIFTAFNCGYRIHLIENACLDRIKKRHNSVFESYSDYLSKKHCK